MRPLKLVRTGRWVLVAILIAQCLLLTSDILGRHLLLAIVPAVLIPGLVFALVLNRRTLANVLEQSRPRPDYARIAELERDIFGEAFDHAGAPELPLSGRLECVSGRRGTKTSGVSFANAEIAAALVSAGYDPADVLAAVGQDEVPAFATDAAGHVLPPGYHCALCEPGRGTLGGMRPGDVCWAVPWALSADGDRLWLDAAYLAGSAPGGTGMVRVERRPDGYHAWSEPGSANYVSEAMRAGKSSGRQYLPVTWHRGYPGVTVRVIQLEPKRTR